MRLVFAGTPEFAVPALVALHEAGQQIALVLTQPDRPVGRGLQRTPSPVKRAALERGLTVSQPTTLKDAAAQAQIAAAAADVMVVVAYGLILPAAVLSATRHGAINIHASLLPRWRGAAPIQRAILAGDAATGIAIMQMEAGLDTGPVWAVERVAIGDADTAGALAERLAGLGARMIVEMLERDLGSGRSPTPQSTAGVTYAHKIEKAEAQLDWTADAASLGRAVRAFNPTPGASAHIRGGLVKIWCATPLAEVASAAPGTVQAVRPDAICVACGRGVLAIHELQRAGGRRLDVRRMQPGGARLQPGDRFDPVPAQLRAG